MLKDERVPTDSAGLEILEEVECLPLLAQAMLGRVAIIHGGLPEILPISYRLVDGEIVFRTGIGGKLSGALLGSSVAFEVDSVEADTGDAWSVRVTATAQVREIDPETDADLLAGLRSWAPRPGPYLVRLTPLRVTGRRTPSLRPKPT